MSWRRWIPPPPKTTPWKKHKSNNSYAMMTLKGRKSAIALVFFQVQSLLEDEAMERDRSPFISLFSGPERERYSVTARYSLRNAIKRSDFLFPPPLPEKQTPFEKRLKKFKKKKISAFIKVYWTATEIDWGLLNAEGGRVHAHLARQISD